MNIRTEIKLTAGDLYRFNIRQVYRGMQGFLSIVLPLLVFANAYVSFGKVSMGWTCLYIGLGILFLVYVPVSLWMRVKKTIANPENALSGVITYEFSDEGIKVSVAEESVELKWEQVYRMLATKKLLLIYTNRINAYILPMAQLTEQYAQISELAHKKLERFRIKMR